MYCLLFGVTSYCILCKTWVVTYCRKLLRKAGRYSIPSLHSMRFYLGQWKSYSYRCNP